MNQKKIYDFSEWNCLNIDIRVDLITLIKDVRQGANIELWKLKRRDLEHFLTQKKYLDSWLMNSGLKFREYKSDYYICKDILLLEQLWSDKIKTGEFLGYPPCCIKHFEEGCQKYLNGSGKGPAIEFWQSVKKAIKKGTFNPTLYYVLHIPCRINCEKTLKLAEKIKITLESKAPEEADYLRKENQRLFLQ